MFYFPTRNRFVLFAITKKRTETIIKSLLCNSRLTRHLSNADDENVRQFNVLMRISRSSYFTFRIFVRFPLESLLNSLWMTVWCCVVHVVRVQRNSPRVVSKHTHVFAGHVLHTSRTIFGTMARTAWILDASLYYSLYGRKNNGI